MAWILLTWMEAKQPFNCPNAEPRSIDKDEDEDEDEDAGTFRIIDSRLLAVS